MKKTKEHSIIYRIAKIIGLISIIVSIYYLLKKLNTVIFDVNLV